MSQNLDSVTLLDSKITTNETDDEAVPFECNPLLKFGLIEKDENEVLMLNDEEIVVLDDEYINAFKGGMKKRQIKLRKEGKENWSIPANKATRSVADCIFYYSPEMGKTTLNRTKTWAEIRTFVKTLHKDRLPTQFNTTMNEIHVI